MPSVSTEHRGEDDKMQDVVAARIVGVVRSPRGARSFSLDVVMRQVEAAGDGANP